METLELKNEVTVGRKRFLIHTIYEASNQTIQAEVSYDSREVLKKEEKLEPADGEFIKEQLGLIHREMITEMELLYYIADKVKSLRHPVSNNKLGLVFLKRNLLEEAIEQFRYAIKKQPDFVEAMNNLGLTCFLEENYEEALKVFQKALEIKDDYADLYNYLGCVHLELGKFKEAIEAFVKALKLNQDYAEAHFNLGHTYIRILYEDLVSPDLPGTDQAQEKALEHVMFAAELLPPDNIKYFDRLNEYIKSKNYEDCFEVIDLIRDNIFRLRYEADFENEFYLKFMFGGKGKDDEYINRYTSTLQQTIEKYPNFADLRNNLGVVYLIQCRNLFLKALDEFRQALKINPDYKRAEKNLKLSENDGKGFLILLRAILK